MKYTLINKINPNYSAIEQILTNRGIKYENIKHYLNTTDNDINKPQEFGEERLRAAAIALIKTIYAGDSALIIVDCDCDGFTSSAILINYLYEIFPTWVENNLHYFLHEDKEHGLSDCMDYIKNRQFSLIICPDASSNDYDYHRQLKEQERQIIILDHHEAERISPYATAVINNQLCDYPNKELSGAGVTWQFCRYLDEMLPQQPDYANNFLDLVALGNMADMMSLKSIETKHLILKGFKEENLKNPFIYGMAQKNSYSLGNKITPMGAAFYIAPFVNAMVRSGTLEEKELLFNSMLKYKAFKEIPSNKRGHKAGEMERVVDQALRTATNVKNRQTRAQDAMMDLFERKIEEDNMMEHKVLLFLLEPGQIDKNIAGLCANKIMAKYQRPVCILTKVIEKRDVGIQTPLHQDRDGNPKILDYIGDELYKDPWTEGKEDEYRRMPMNLEALNMKGFVWASGIEETITYQGSARGCDKVGINNFKDICAETGCIMYAEGHQGAFGLGIAADNIDNFIEKTNELLKDMSDEPVYYVDYVYNGVDVNSENILDIARLDDLWGKDMDEPYIAIHDLKVSKEMLTLMSPDKKPTLKITLPNKVSLIKFGSSQEEYESLLSEGYIALDVVGKCNANEWNGWTTAQILIEDYEIIGQNRYCF